MGVRESEGITVVPKALNMEEEEVWKGADRSDNQGYPTVFIYID